MISKSVVVWVGRVPAALCASEEAVRELFEGFGRLVAVRIQHNHVDMSTDGFMFLEYSSRRAAERAIAAVQRGDIEGGGDKLCAAPALQRGSPDVADVDDDVRDLLLGRRSVNVFSQRSMAEDDEDLVLQSLSQPSQRRRHKRRKVRA